MRLKAVGYMRVSGDTFCYPEPQLDHRMFGSTTKVWMSMRLLCVSFRYIAASGYYRTFNNSRGALCLQISQSRPEFRGSIRSHGPYLVT